MKYEIRSIGIWSFIKQSFFVNLVIGFVMGLFYAMFMGTFLSVLQNLPMSDAYGTGLARVPLVMLMVFIPPAMAFGAAFFNTILGFIAVITYNFVGRFVGGIEMTLEPVAAEQHSRTYATSAEPASYGVPPPPPPSSPSISAIPPAMTEPRRSDPPPASKYE